MESLLIIKAAEPWSSTQNQNTQILADLYIPPVPPMSPSTLHTCSKNPLPTLPNIPKALGFTVGGKRSSCLFLLSTILEAPLPPQRHASTVGGSAGWWTGQTLVTNLALPLMVPHRHWRVQTEELDGWNPPQSTGHTKNVSGKEQLEEAGSLSSSLFWATNQRSRN